MIYQWDWNGDEAVDTEGERVASGTTVTLSHSFDSPGMYSVQCRAMDAKGELGSWSDPIPVRISQGSFTPQSGDSTLTVSRFGNGTVISIPAGIHCGDTCTASFPSNTSVALTATPDSGWSFAGRGGECRGTSTCNLTMDADKSVIATFYQLPSA